jgi:hypothetical protein
MALREFNERQVDLKLGRSAETRVVRFLSTPDGIGSRTVRRNVLPAKTLQDFAVSGMQQLFI